jgi:hypothetical protein
MSTERYLSLITSEHSERPRFVATVEACVAPFAKVQDVLRSLPQAFDVDTATGVQLDAVGRWVGIGRRVASPISGVYLEWDNDSAPVGWEEGVWKDEFDPDDGLLTLPDESYRLLIKAKIAANHWDGTIPGIYAVWEQVFQGSSIIVEDLQDMTMTVGVSGVALSTLDTKLLLDGYLVVKPAGVRIRDYAIIPVAGVLFAWDFEETEVYGGWEIGKWTSY